MMLPWSFLGSTRQTPSLIDCGCTPRSRHTTSAQSTYYSPKSTYRGQCGPRHTLDLRHKYLLLLTIDSPFTTGFPPRRRLSVTHDLTVISSEQKKGLPTPRLAVRPAYSPSQTHTVVSHRSTLNHTSSETRPDETPIAGPRAHLPAPTIKDRDDTAMCFITERPMSPHEYTSPRAPRRASNYHAGPSRHSVGYNHSSVSSLPSNSSRSSVRRYVGGSGMQDALVVYEKRRPVKVNEVVYV